MKSIRIGNGAGFWGDNLDAPRLLAAQGKLDYLTLEYLAELTLSILAAQKIRQPNLGYVPDFLTVLESLHEELQAQPGLRIVSNAGGMNPQSCAIRAGDLLNAFGLGDLKIGVVTGDDLLPRLDDLLVSGEDLANMETGQPLGERRTLVASANVYLGAAGIVAALEQESRVVITGRVADASLTLGPLIHEFSWKPDDWDRLAAGTVAGHLIECGAQVTGGMYSNWSSEIPLADVGYPIAVCAENGDVQITKPPKTGGIVTCETVAEQLVYEIGDPAHYLTPDVDADFSHVRLAETAANTVAVTGARGAPQPERYKVSLAYRDGYMGSGTLVVTGPRAEEKARACGEMLLARVRRAGVSLARTNIECLGSGDSVPGLWQRLDPPEVVLRVSAHDPEKGAIERFLREFAPLVTSGPPGVTGYTGPRPKAYPVMAYWPATISREHAAPAWTVRTAREWSQSSVKSP